MGSKSIESGRQTVRRLRWMMLRVEMAREVKEGEGFGIGFVAVALDLLILS